MTQVQASTKMPSLKRSFAEYLTTGVIAQYCEVSRVTVMRWIRKRYLPAFRLPSGQYRIRRDDFSKFLTKHGIPISRQIFKENHRGQANV